MFAVCLSRTFGFMTGYLTYAVAADTSTSCARAPRRVAGFRGASTVRCVARFSEERAACAGSVHVSRILAKLEVTSRGEAGAVAHKLGLDGA